MLRAGALDDPEGWYRDRGGRGVQDGEHMYTRGGFMAMYGETTTILWSHKPPIKINKFILKINNTNSEYEKNPLVYSALWMDLFTCFVTFCIWSSGMYWFTKLCSSSKCWHISLYNIQKKKSHIHYYHPALREVFSVGSCQTQSGRYKFSKIQIFAWKSNFIIGNKYCQLTGNFVHFRENVCQIVEPARL